MWRWGQRLEWCHYKRRSPRSPQELQEASRGPPLETWEGENGPADILIAGSGTPAQWEGKVSVVVISHSSPKKIIWPQAREKKRQTLCCTPSSWALSKVFLLGKLHLHSVPRKFHVHWYCAFHVDLDLGLATAQGLHRGRGSTRQNDSVPPGTQPTSSRLDSDPYRRHRWGGGRYAVLLSNQLKSKYDRPIYLAQKIKDHNGRCFRNQPREFLKGSETQDFPSGLQDRDKCHSPSPSSPSSSLLGLVFLFIYFFPCVFHTMTMSVYERNYTHSRNQ